MKKQLLIVSMMMFAVSGYGAGFSLYEASSRGNAMGGALVGKTGDASAMYYNPANMTDNTNVSISVGLTVINPYCDVKVNGQKQTKMNSGFFYAPNFYLTMPAFIIDGLHLGFGGYSEFGLGSEYDQNWLLSGDTVQTEIAQYSFAPAISYDITDWWSVAAGLRFSYFYFYNEKHPQAGTWRYLKKQYAGTPMSSFIPGDDALSSHLEGDDGAIGYFLATKIKITDDLHFGAVWRSQIRHKVRGDFKLDVNDYRAQIVALKQGTLLQHQDSWAQANVCLPQSVTLGLNYDITEDWRVGATAIWTQWSKMHEIVFQMPNYGYTQDMSWRNVWRFGFGTEYDVTDWLQARLGYVYDMDPCNQTWGSTSGSTMLPEGNRHIVAAGLGFWITPRLRFDLGYSIIIMNQHSKIIYEEIGGTAVANTFDTRNGFSHLISGQLTYNF